MAKKVSKSSGSSSSHKKRHGLHHKKTKRYHTTYHPFIPVLIIIIGIFISVSVRTVPAALQVLAFATEMSSQGLLEATNQQRERYNAPELQLNETLSAAAQRKAEDMAQRDYWSHETPDGEEPWIFINEVGYQYNKAGENLAYGFLTSQQTVNGWMNSDSHRENMLDPAFSEVGFGYVNAVNYQDSDKETIVVAMYALPSSSATFTMTVPENEDTQATTTQRNEGDIPTETSAIPVVVASDSDTDSGETLQQVSRVESLLDNRYSWATFALGIMSGGAGVGLLASHGMRVRKWLRKGEQFVLHHPLLDATLLSLAALGVFLLDGVGYLL